MSGRKFFLWVTLILFTPHISLASGLNDLNSVYVGIQYKPAKQHISKLLIKESAADTAEVFALKKDLSGALLDNIKTNSNFTEKYNPHYENNCLGFSVLFGYYYNENFRIESEISHEIFHIKNDGYKGVDFEKHFALAREVSTSEYVTLINNGITATSASINFCHDIDTLKHNTIVYSCLGFGVDIIDFLSKYTTKFSYQGKLGASYPISSRALIFVEGYYHGLFSKKFEKVPVNYPCDSLPATSLQVQQHITAAAILDIVYYGGSIGIKFIL